jgi:hypothetical protein
MGSVMLGRQKYTQQNHKCLKLRVREVEMDLEKLKIQITRY